MNFSGIGSIARLIKTAELEVLLHNISSSAENGTTVLPVKCPGKGRVEDYGKTDTGEAACVFNGNNCPYFKYAEFSLESYLKKILCVVDSKVK